MLENTLQSVVSALSENPMKQCITPFEQSFTVAPGQNHQTQLQFFRTTQKCGRKRQNILK